VLILVFVRLVQLVPVDEMVALRNETFAPSGGKPGYYVVSQKTIVTARIDKPTNAI